MNEHLVVKVIRFKIKGVVSKNKFLQSTIFLIVNDLVNTELCFTVCRRMQGL